MGLFGACYQHNSDMCKVNESPVSAGSETITAGRIKKNVWVVSVAFMVQFSAAGGMGNLQSSINADRGGTFSMASGSLGCIFSSIFLPVVIIKWLNSKWTVAFCFIGLIPCLLAQLKPTFYTLVSTGVLSGLVAAPLWCAMCTYIAALSEAHSKISGESKELLLGRYLGLFFMVFNFSELWGNLIASVVLATKDNIAAVTSVNASQIPEVCGANFLPSADSGKALQHQPHEKIQMLVGIYLGLVVAAIIIASVGLDSPKRFKAVSLETEKSGWTLILATMTLTLECKQLLLMPISIFIGLYESFAVADFTASFVSCAVGAGAVGYVMMLYGISDALGCGLNGYLTKLVGRVLLVSFAICLTATMFVTMLTWKPQADVIYVHYVIAFLAGLCHSVWMVQINAYYGVLFPGREEAAFASFRLFESIGMIIGFSVSTYLRTSIKIYYLFTILMVGSIGYFTEEYTQAKLTKTLSRELGIVEDFDNKFL